MQNVRQTPGHLHFGGKDEFDKMVQMAKGHAGNPAGAP
jgi:hypothetical protein